MIGPDERTTVRNATVDRRVSGENGATGMDIAALLARTGATPRVETRPAARQWDADTLATAITEVANRFSRTPIDADTDFFDAGGTSLDAVELVAALQRELDVHPDLDTVFFDARPRRLAHRWLADHPESVLPETKPHREAENDDLAQLFADLSGADRLPLVAAPERVAPRHILLTGATGFLGSHLLLDLLRHSEAHVVCLVRADDDQAAAQRLEQAVRRFALPWSREVLRRVTPLAGDLREPRLGQSEERWNSLAAEVDSIVNAGAAVDFLRGYPSLRRTNVLGPLTLAELACTGRPKPVHHISSLAVFNGSEATTLGEDEPTANVAALPIGYDRSKWAAEAILRRAGEHGLVVTILRPGGIGSHPETGAHNPRDLNAGITAALMRFRTVPGFRYLNAAPVDWVSRVAAEVVGTPSAWGHTYHLTGAPTSLEQLVAETTLGGLGIRVQHWEQWCEETVRGIKEGPVPELESLAQVLQSPVARTQLAAMVTAPPAAAARTEAFVAAQGLPAPVTPGPAARGKMLAAMAGGGPQPDADPYLRFRETLTGTIGPVGETADIQCDLRLTLSVASSAQVFSARTLDVSGELTCGGLHTEPLTVTGTAIVRPHDGIPLRHETRHPIMHYQLTLRDSSGGTWWLAGYKFAAARRRLVRQLGTQVIEIGRTGEPACYAGEVAVPMHTYLPDQIDGIEIDPRLPERQRRLAKLLWLSWFGGQLGKSVMEPVLRVGTDLLDLRRALRKEQRR
ncbi:thioester reductase domain-containing protein [Nocardia sp. NPDC050712]|uniref:thioester reductase domain-containing protein n=1 Tax=Nocardia sp. NPDC050712 TaxID=3155518 RepID=UPI0033C09001